jgi:hypothetical protein
MSHCTWCAITPPSTVNFECSLDEEQLRLFWSITARSCPFLQFCIAFVGERKARHTLPLPYYGRYCYLFEFGWCWGAFPPLSPFECCRGNDTVMRLTNSNQASTKYPPISHSCSPPRWFLPLESPTNYEYELILFNVHYFIKSIASSDNLRFIFESFACNFQRHEMSMGSYTPPHWTNNLPPSLSTLKSLGSSAAGGLIKFFHPALPTPCSSCEN